MIIFENEFNKISSSDIDLFENNLSMSLPDEYKAFLLNSNGGISPNLKYFDFEEEDSVIDAFFGIELQKKDRNYDLEINHIRMENRCPIEFLPIAIDAFGNKILLNLDNKSVYFWDHELEADESNGDDPLNYYNNIKKISDSFNEFLRSLYS